MGRQIDKTRPETWSDDDKRFLWERAELPEPHLGEYLAQRRREQFEAQESALRGDAPAVGIPVHGTTNDIVTGDANTRGADQPGLVSMAGATGGDGLPMEPQERLIALERRRAADDREIELLRAALEGEAEGQGNARDYVLSNADLTGTALDPALQGEDPVVGGDEDAPYEEWTKAELQDEARERELDASGTKAELVERLRSDDESKQGSEPAPEPANA